MRNSLRKLHTEHDSTQQTTTILDNTSSVIMRGLIILEVCSGFLCLVQSTLTLWRSDRKLDKDVIKAQNDA